jgi:hypothetical protein
LKNNLGKKDWGYGLVAEAFSSNPSTARKEGRWEERKGEREREKREREKKKEKNAV